MNVVVEILDNFEIWCESYETSKFELQIYLSVHQANRKWPDSPTIRALIKNLWYRAQGGTIIQRSRHLLSCRKGNQGGSG